MTTRAPRAPPRAGALRLGVGQLLPGGGAAAGALTAAACGTQRLFGAAGDDISSVWGWRSASAAATMAA